VALTPKCFDLLVVLIENSGHLLEKDELLERLWPGQIVEEANLSFNISSLRKALGEGHNGQRFIETVPKKGFRFVAQVEERRSSRSSLTEEAIDEAALEEDVSKSVLPLQSTLSAGVRLNLKILIGITAAGVLALAIIAYGIWIGKSKAEPPPLRVVPFTSYEGNETQPAFSPDGRYIAFVWKGERGDNVDIYVKPVDGGTPLRLTTDPARDSSPVWSPDGRHVAFVRRSNEANGIYEVDVPAGPERKVADFRPGASFLLGRCLDWSPDGKTLAIAERVGKSNSHAIFLVSVETGEERQLTTPEAEDTGDVEPAFSRDGRLLAFVRESHYLVTEIYVIPAAGGEPRRITFDNKKVLAIAWTADGRELVFSSDPNGNFTLRRIPVAGGEAVPLAGTSGFSSGWGNHIDDLSISRHTNRIVYTQWFQDVNTYRIEAARSSAQSGTPEPFNATTQWESNIQYSPDGKSIVFASDRSGNLEIWVCASDGSNTF
jgi:Tol biopolymer transport system component/DNA-binding winged helix-turn-helix (wHTH) protein